MKKIEIWRICVYFIIYSIIGFVLETVFAFLAYHVIESRQSFLYGPFCTIYGIGAISMILILSKYDKNNIKLFLGGMLVGSLSEYMISLIGEKIFGMRFWDYSNEVLNINGRVCLSFSIIWGIAAFILIKYINPCIDHNLEKFCINDKRIKFIKVMVWICIMFILIDCIVTYIVVDFFIVESAKKYNLELKGTYGAEIIYNYTQKNHNFKEILTKYATADRIILALPNLGATLKDGTQIKLQDLTPGIKNCYYRFKN